MLSKKLLITLSLLINIGIFVKICVASPVETYQFTHPVQKQRYQKLIEELRCPKCQNQNLADSNSPISQDLRQQVYEQIQQGRADQEIVDYMVYRYGEFILYRPKLSKKTYFLWFGPIVFIVIGLVALVIITRRQRHNKRTIDKAQSEELNNLLKSDHDHK